MSTIGERYGPAMDIIDQDAADIYFDQLVNHAMEKHGLDRDAAQEQERRNLGYYAGYYSADTRRRVERLFACSHPIFSEVARNGPHTGIMASNEYAKGWADSQRDVSCSC